MVGRDRLSGEVRIEPGQYDSGCSLDEVIPTKAAKKTICG